MSGMRPVATLLTSFLFAASIVGPVAAAGPGISFNDDFSTPIGDRWDLHGGTWEIVDGRLQGLGEVDRLNAPDPASGGGVDLAGAVATVHGLTATNVTVCLDMTALERPDKGVVLRWRGPKDGIWLGFRGRESEDYPSDLTVEQAIRGVPTLLTPEFSIPIDVHDIGDTIHACATLVGQRLRVVIDGRRVLDRSFPFQVRAGAVGVHALADNLVAYDNVRVTVAPPATDATALVASVGRGNDAPLHLVLLSATGWLVIAIWLRRRTVHGVAAARGDR